ncbi:GNAT family N-acetyltransferase [Dactylosporangium sp. CA-052675]|uniref:GNAT family N-acetyltransferase n=1 Tax=Dactylosporangium sp. CA-052675 TaxID=3239927 RepID=UPI003D91144A
MEVRPLTPGEWQLKRDLRLSALKDSPHAFASTWAREAKRGEADWRTWPAGGAFFTAFGPLPPSRPRVSAPSRAARHDPPALGTPPGTGDGRHDPPGYVVPGGRHDPSACVVPLGIGDGRRDLPGCVVPLGIAGAWVAAADPATTHLISMWVVPAARGHGIAARLADAVTAWARDHGHDTVELELACGNTAALNAYLRCGFSPAGRKPFTAGGTVLTRPTRRPPA